MAGAWASPRPPAPASRPPTAKSRRPPAPDRAARPWCAAGDEGARREASRAERRAGFPAPGAPPRPAPARASARPPGGPPPARRGRGPAGPQGFPRGTEGALGAAGAEKARAARKRPEGHCRPGVSGRLGICSLLPILSASGPRSPLSGEAKAAAAAAWPQGGEGGERAGRCNLAETEAKAPESPEWSRARLGAALRRALRRGPALSPERLALASSHRGRAAGGGGGRVVLAAGRRAGGGTERAQCGELRAVRTGSEAARSPRPRALRSSRRVTRQSCFQAPGAPHPPAGGPAAVRFARASAPPASSLLPPSLRLPARTGRARGAVRGRRGGGKALLAPGSSACRGSGDVGSSAEKSRNVLGCGCSSSLSQ